MWFIRLRKKLLELIRFTLSGAKHKCLILGTPAHKNLGDHAIVYAEYKFLKDYFGNCNIMEMSLLEYTTYKKIVSLITSKHTLVVVDGGGNLGTLWPIEDNCIRDILYRFKKNPVMVFPQTAYYDASTEGKKIFEETVRLINCRSNIMFMFRDYASYSMYKERVANDKLILCPDIVTYIDDVSRSAGENGNTVGICFRDDKENIMNSDERMRIVDYIKSAGFDCIDISTISPVNVHEAERNSVLMDKWNQFGKCDYIITDRLHGMIFSVITGTKCIAFDNISKKIYGGYQWFKEIGYVKYCENFDSFTTLFEELKQQNNYQYCRDRVIKDYYGPLYEFMAKIN